MAAQMTDTIEDLMAAGILDPAKVTRSGLTNACGIAGIMLTTQAIMVQKPKPKSAANPLNNPGFSASGMPAGLTM